MLAFLTVLFKVSPMQPYIGLFWDESHLWGILVYHFLKHSRAKFVPITAKEIAAGKLNDLKPQWLIVPGGWASLKFKKLGSEGQQEIKSFLTKGGNYLGFCGGAGLASSSPNSLGLCPLKRKEFKQRLPNFSGDIWCKVFSLDRELLFPVWWPSQFEWESHHPHLEVLATYQRPGADFWVSDLKLEDLNPGELKKWENLYAINLDPLLLTQEPCIIRGDFGKGKYILSYPHLETPNSPQANTYLQQLLALSPAFIPDLDFFSSTPKNTFLGHWKKQLLDLIALGEAHFLLFKRRKWLLAWRRGIPGSFFNFLLALMSFLEDVPENFLTDEQKQKIEALSQKFLHLSTRFILKERYLLSKTPSTPIASSNSEQQKLKKYLFGSFPGYGGIYGELINLLDELALAKARLETSQNLLQ